MAQERTKYRFRRSGPESVEELRELEDVRAKVRQEFPARDPPRLLPATAGVGARIREAREAKGLTWYAVAQQAEIGSASVVRDIEFGRDAKLSDIESVARVLGLRLERVEV